MTKARPSLQKLDLFHSTDVLFAEYSHSISIPRNTFPYYGIGQNYGNWIFQPFSSIFLKYLRTIDEGQFFQCFPPLNASPNLTVVNPNSNFWWARKECVAFFVFFDFWSHFLFWCQVGGHVTCVECVPRAWGGPQAMAPTHAGNTRYCSWQSAYIFRLCWFVGNKDLKKLKVWPLKWKLLMSTF